MKGKGPRVERTANAMPFSRFLQNFCWSARRTPCHFHVSSRISAATKGKGEKSAYSRSEGSIGRSPRWKPRNSATGARVSDARLGLNQALGAADSADPESEV